MSTSFRIASSVICLALSVPVQAEGGGLRGVVRSSDGWPLRNVSVAIADTDKLVLTDEEGAYSFEGLDAGYELTLVASLEGFSDARKTVMTGAVEVVDIVLEIAGLAETLVVATDIPIMSAAEEISSVRLSPEQVAVLPSLGEKDLFRAFQLLPGVRSSESSSGLFVRGSTPDQNLVTYDGFTVYHIDHLFGYFSAFNMEAVGEARLHKGAIEAQYGGRLSSVVEIEGRTGDSEKVHFQAGASLLSANGLAEFPLFGRGSLLLAGRRSFQSSLYDKILGQVNATPAPRGGVGTASRLARFETQPSSYFYDLNGKLSLELASRTLLTASAYNGRDDVDNSRDLQLPDFALERLAERGIDIGGTLSVSDVNRWENLGAGLKLTHHWSDTAQSVASLGYSRFENDRDRSAGGFGRPPGGEENEAFRPRAATGSAEDNELRDYTFRLDNSFQLAWNHHLQAGVQITDNKIDYLLGVEEETAGSDGTASLESGDILDLASSGRQLSAYIQDRWTLLERVTLNAGVRATSFDVTEQTYLEPRLSLSVVVSDGLRLKGAWEKHNQVVSRITRGDVVQGNREFWALSDDDLVPVASSSQIMAGASYETGNLLVDLELYSKDLDNLTEFAPRFLLLPGQDETDFPDFFYRGHGVARGLELLVQKKFGNHNGWLSYTLGEIEHTFPDLADGPYPATHDQTHEFKLVDTLRLGSWRLSGTFIYSTGRPYTEPVGIEEVGLPAGQRTIQQVVVGEKNGARLPSYNRLDLAANWEFALGSSQGLIGVTLFNAYNRKNVWYREFEAVEDELIENDILLMGRTLNVSVSLRF